MSKEEEEAAVEGSDVHGYPGTRHTNHRHTRRNKTGDKEADGRSQWPGQRRARALFDHLAHLSLVCRMSVHADSVRSSGASSVRVCARLGQTHHGAAGQYKADALGA